MSDIRRKAVSFAGQLNDAGSLDAVFSTFGVVDADGEVVTYEALLPWDGKQVPMVWGHDWRSLDAQVGKGTIVVEPTRARIVGQFNLATQAGRDAYETVKFNGDLQQYSWGFGVTDSTLRPTADGTVVPHITGVIPYEVSPVLVGSNPITGTLAIRSLSEYDEKGALSVHHTPTEDVSWDGPAVVADAPNTAAVLRYMHAWVDDSGDPTAKASYKFPHHDGRGAPANVAAVRNGLARLSRAAIPDADRAGVQRHLEAHLADSQKGDTAVEDGVKQDWRWRARALVTAAKEGQAG